MRNIHYKGRSFRLSDEVYKLLKKKKPKELSWNLYFKKLLEKNNYKKEIKYKIV